MSPTCLAMAANESTSSSQSVAPTESLALPDSCGSTFYVADDFSTTFSFYAYRTNNEMALQYLTILWGKKSYVVPKYVAD